jgi:hypothetical protein
MAVLLDSGFLLASLNASEAEHQATIKVLERALHKKSPAMIIKAAVYTKSEPGAVATGSFRDGHLRRISEILLSKTFDTWVSTRSLRLPVLTLCDHENLIS